MYIAVKQAAEKWGVSDRRVRFYVQRGKFLGHIKKEEAGKYHLML